MSGRKISNMGGSVRQRLLNLARQRGEDFGLLLTNYAAERFLYRLSQSVYQEHFALKGAVLFKVWADQPYRATRDLDLLALRKPTVPEMEQAIRNICKTVTEDDGLQFTGPSIRTEEITGRDEYEGVRVRLEARLASARIPLQIDIGFGDIVTPSLEITTLPTILDFPPPTLKAYPRETVVAEKFQAMVSLGIANSRMKDYCDVYVLAQHYPFDGTTLSKAISATFLRRNTTVPTEVPVALSREFCVDKGKNAQWNAFIGRGRLLTQAETLRHVISFLCGFLLPPTHPAAGGQAFRKTWTPPGPWSP